MNRISAAENCSACGCIGNMDAVFFIKLLNYEMRMAEKILLQIVKNTLHLKKFNFYLDYI